MTAFFSVIGALAVGYGCGSVPFALLVGKFNGIDIRKYGSGNVGATNVRRVLGRGWGRFCFFMDVAKGLVPVLAVSLLTPLSAGSILAVLAAAAAVAGHIFPFWLRFRGGKGVATTIGALLILAPLPVLIALLGWVAVYYGSRYVSLASLTAAAALPVSAHALQLGSEISYDRSVLVLLWLLALLIVVRHRSNIARLLQGTEHRFEAKRPTTRGKG